MAARNFPALAIALGNTDGNTAAAAIVFESLQAQLDEAAHCLLALSNPLRLATCPAFQHT